MLLTNIPALPLGRKRMSTSYKTPAGVWAVIMWMMR